MDNLSDTLTGRSVAPLKEFCRGNGKGLQAIEVDWDALCDKMKVRLDRDLTLPETAS
ncbi:hypothetical protein J3R80_05640 [Aliiroseovarius sp. Z3]|uniref:hypothetical protein n=1 Tax=Aliiroseovarius sp. Z3 TaxID=2811402 RepID=UPI0023B2606D|nr:hypothetical protein [Aliiroseovarius sp. Z3]MDE9449950.1 hypothetical protein [Aliiroseovarius sp. Z3]